MALPLIAVAATLLPELVRIVAGDRAGTATAQVAEAVRTITGTEEPEAVRRIIAEDPAKASELQVRLAEIALDQQRVQQEAADKARQAELDTLRLRTADLGGARGAMTGLAAAGSSIAWGAPLMSGIITVGFFTFTLTLLFSRFDPTSGSDQFRASLLNIIVGALVAAFTAVVNFWLGSSQGSREKDAAVQNLQAAQAAQASQAIRGMEELARTTAQSGGAPGGAPALALLRSAAPSGAAEARFTSCVEVVLEHEGGFSDHPEDPGGATNFGITLKTLQDFRGAEVSKDEVRELTRDEAKEIYRARYWNVMSCADLPPGVDLMLFDFGVNAGPSRAIKMLQKSAGVVDDGSIGPITLAAIRAGNAARLISDFAGKRMEYYRALDSFPTFGRGWTRRTDMVKQAALRMAAASGGS